MNDRHALRYGMFCMVLLVVLGLVVFSIDDSPEPDDSAPSSQASTAAEVTPNNVATDTAAPSTLESLRELDGKPPARRRLDIQSWTTAEGARVLFVAAPQLPMFDLRLTFAAGSSRDAQTPGLALLTNAMLNEGVPGKDVTAIAEGFENLGADFNNGAYRDMAVVSLRSLSAKPQREAATALFAEVIGQPQFPAESLARIKNQLLAGFEYQKQNPAKLGNLELFGRLYGEHPYAHPSEGTATSIPAIERAQLQAFHQQAYAAGNTVIALVGDLTREQAQTLVNQVSAALPKGPALPPTGAPTAPKSGLTHLEFPSNQTHLLLAGLGIDRRDPDYAALYLGNQVFGGGGFGSRLMSEVREKRGLTYGVYSGFSPMQARGPFNISLQTRADQSEGTLQLVQQLLRDFLKEGPTEQELDDAKREMAGSFPLSTASNADIVGQLGSIGFYDLPLSWLEDFVEQVQALSAEQVKSAMNRHLDADALVIVSVGPSVEQKPLPEPSAHPVAPLNAVPEH